VENVRKGTKGRAGLTVTVRVVRRQVSIRELPKAAKFPEVARRIVRAAQSSIPKGFKPLNPFRDSRIVSVSFRDFWMDDVVCSVDKRAFRIRVDSYGRIRDRRAYTAVPMWNAADFLSSIISIGRYTRKGRSCYFVRNVSYRVLFVNTAISKK